MSDKYLRRKISSIQLSRVISHCW